MKLSFTKIITGFIITVSVLYLLAFAWFPFGYVETTRKNGVNLGCVCHGDTASPVVSVTITGPDSVPAGLTALYTVTVSNGPAVVGGFNVASQFGTLDTLIGSGTRKDSASGELTHSAPKLFAANIVSWIFKYTAPGSPIADTLFATGNSANNDSSTSNDNWNWSINKNVRVYNPIGIITISSIAEGFSLSQNYPNPFNPVTQINFSVGKTSDVQIKVYDLLGNVVAMPVNENLKQGEYKADFNASGLASGAYFYSLIVNGGKVSTKKMLMIK